MSILILVGVAGKQEASLQKCLLLSNPECLLWTHAQIWAAISKKDSFDEQEVWFTLHVHSIVFLQPTQKIIGRVSVKTNICYLKCVWGFLPFAPEILKRN